MMETANTLVHGGANCEPKRLVFKVVETEPWGMGEVFQVEDLLDFSGDEIGDPIFDDCIATLSEHANESSSVYTELESSSAKWVEKICTRAPNVDQSNQAFGELCVPSDELADQLEWLSNFVEDSYPAHEVLGPLSGLGNSTSDSRATACSFESRSPVSVLQESNTVSSFRPSKFSSNMYIPGRRRSKRSRTGGRVWSLHTLMPPSPKEAHTGTSAHSTIESENETQTPSSEQESTDSSGPPKRANKRTKLSETPLARKCSHCLVQKTPQWRAGPMGPKTLCNACGVRYKSGRLMPEYRPAGSPTFVTEIHSNSHKKILEMRRHKEQGLPVQLHSHHQVLQQLSEGRWGGEAGAASESREELGDAQGRQSREVGAEEEEEDEDDEPACRDRDRGRGRGRGRDRGSSSTQFE